MKIGLVYPQTEFGSDPAAIRDYAQLAEELGFSHILAYDHVLGANPDRPGGLARSLYLPPYLHGAAYSVQLHGRLYRANPIHHRHRDPPPTPDRLIRQASCHPGCIEQRTAARGSRFGLESR